MAEYRVHGYALCSVEVEMVIEAADGPAAVMAAQARFEASNRKGDFVVSGSADERHPEQWAPLLVGQV